MLLLLVLYYSVLGAAVATYDDTHRASMGDTTAVPVLHMPNTSSTCRMAWCVCSCARSCMRMSTISQLHRKVRASSVHAETVALSISRPKLVDLLRTSLFVAIAVDTPCSISSLVEEDDLCILLPSASRQRLQRH